MRILLDECVPRPLKRELTDYEVRTVVEMGSNREADLIPLISKARNVLNTIAPGEVIEVRGC